MLRGFLRAAPSFMVPTGRRSVPRGVWLAFVLAGTGCATSRNYLDPSGPWYSGDHAPAPVAEAPAVPLRVVTFNIEYGRRVEEAIAELKQYPPLRSPDVLCLQEMDAPGVDRIARVLGLNYVYYPGSRDGKTGRDFGNAVLTRWPIEESWKVLLPHTSRILHRARAAAAVRVRREGGTLTIYSVHLGSPIGISGGQRRDQAKAVLADLQARSGPAVIAGDFNSKSLGEVFVAAGLAWPTRGVGGTVKVGYSFDHVFARGLVTAQPQGAGVVREAKEASDHHPVWALLLTSPEVPEVSP